MNEINVVIGVKFNVTGAKKIERGLQSLAEKAKQVCLLLPKKSPIKISDRKRMDK